MCIWQKFPSNYTEAKIPPILQIIRGSSPEICLCAKNYHIGWPFKWAFQPPVLGSPAILIQQNIHSLRCIVITVNMIVYYETNILLFFWPLYQGLKTSGISHEGVLTIKPYTAIIRLPFLFYKFWNSTLNSCFMFYQMLKSNFINIDILVETKVLK